LSPESARAVCARLRAIGDPLFALLDAARDPKVLAAIQDSDQPYQSLYEGAEADDLAAYGPYLVGLDDGDTMLRRLVEEGWGRSWGVYLASSADFDTIRQHLRRYLKVEIPGGTTALFRFYDPRVLREFLECWTPNERESFLGPVACCIIEDAEGSVIPQEYRHAMIDNDQPARSR